MSGRNSETQLRRLVEEWLAGLGAEDDSSDWYEQHWANEFVYVNSSGIMFEKPELLELNASAGTAAAAYRLRSIDVLRLYGDVALLVGQYFGRSSYGPEVRVPNLARAFATIGIEERFSSAWVWRDERWQCLTWHTTAIFG